jgi:L-serine dehydratase
MMNALSVFDLFKIGLGPSSSHTNGPMKAALYFSEILGHQLDQVQRIQVSCYGSLALTGKGHGTDKAILLGLQGIAPENATSALVAQTYQKVQADQKIHLAGKKWLPFHIDLDLLWERSKTLPKHPNGMKFQAFDLANQIIKESIIYSVGGGFIHIENAKPMESQATKSIPYIFESAKDLLELGEKHQLKLWQIVLENEKTHMLESRVREKIDLIWSVMIQTMEHGFTQTGTLPGGMKVRRRSPELYKHLLAKGTGNSTDPLLALDWINLFALSVNEENASFGRIVTAPTNGAAGVIPAVLRYYRDFIPGATQEGIHRFFLTATAIGTLYKMNASISGAEVGCQGEVGTHKQKD